MLRHSRRATRIARQKYLRCRQRVAREVFQIDLDAQPRWAASLSKNNFTCDCGMCRLSSYFGRREHAQRLLAQAPSWDDWN